MHLLLIVYTLHHMTTAQHLTTLYRAELDSIVEARLGKGGRDWRLYIGRCVRQGEEREKAKKKTPERVSIYCGTRAGNQAPDYQSLAN
ncbi:hypothetical protein Pmani_027901 [Petrolisthes manimaculis]|uniref:Uncharacterized protein n=1 Tax=Petrolisthes manimaculis TaxID=1843537 RepID=A0AAE1P0H4_9EUCA|nr:hypothetical protein Pmani_027901 [Petrolisthes manimaculis]